MTEHLAVALANTRSSAARDRIATAAAYREWAGGWPVLGADGIDPAGLERVHALRDAAQDLLHALAEGRTPTQAQLDRATLPGLDRAGFRLVPSAGGVAVERAGEHAEQLLARAVVDFLLGPDAARVRRCAGHDCRKVFVASRAGRRWCDSAVCGNRARVAAHSRRRGEA